VLRGFFRLGGVRGILDALLLGERLGLGFFRFRADVMRGFVRLGGVRVTFSCVAKRK
jgi:hypothetical protein